jgi:hypothetical protein
MKNKKLKKELMELYYQYLGDIITASQFNSAVSELTGLTHAQVHNATIASWCCESKMKDKVFSNYILSLMEKKEIKR